MKKPFICLDCLTTFDNLLEITENHGLDTLPFETMYVCPYCHSSMISDALYCDLCGYPIHDEYIVTVDGDRICDNCQITKTIEV